MNNWREVNDTNGLKDWQEYLVCAYYYSENKPFIIIAKWDNDNREFFAAGQLFIATHWMPLPELPEIK